MSGSRIPLHARNHLRGGSDPLKDLIAAGLEYAYIQSGIGDTLPAGPTTHKNWWDMAAPSGAGAGPFTNAPDTFSIQTETIAPGIDNVNSGDFRGLSIDKPGMYVAFKNILIASLYSDTVLRAISVYQGGSHHPTFTSVMVFGDQNHVNQGHGQHFEIWSVFAGDAPTGPILLFSQNGEASAYTCDVSLLVVRLDTTGIVL